MFPLSSFPSASISPLHSQSPSVDLPALCNVFIPSPHLRRSFHSPPKLDKGASSACLAAVAVPSCHCILPSSFSSSSFPPFIPHPTPCRSLFCLLPSVHYLLLWLLPSPPISMNTSSNLFTNVRWPLFCLSCCLLLLRKVFQSV